MPALPMPANQATHVSLRYLSRWDLIPDGEPLTTASSVLLPVRQCGRAAMLKVATGTEERAGNTLMAWWNGHGAATVIRHEGAAILLERATGPRSLQAMAGTNIGSTDWLAADNTATQVLCEVALTLHSIGRAPERTRPADLIPLDRWFADLLAQQGARRGFLHRAAVTAGELLAAPQDVVVLHGDLHHGNVLDFGTTQAPAWRAIDPKFLVGERGFDFANIVCNPSHAAAAVPGRLDRLVSMMSAEAGIERTRLLRWITAWTGLSYVWHTTGPTSVESDAAAQSVLRVGRAAEDLLRAECEASY